jgi:WD40 repeat protein
LDGTANVWDTASGNVLLTLRGHARALSDVAFSPDGKRLSTSSLDGTAEVWNAVSGQLLLTLGGHTAAVSGVAFSPDGKRLATSSLDGTAKVWDAVSGQLLLTLSGHTAAISGVAFSPEGKRLATSSLDGTAKVWDAATGQVLLTLRCHTGVVSGVAFSPNGRRLATASWGQTAQVWDAISGQELLTFRPRTGAVFAVAFSPDGKHLATATADHTVKLWDAFAWEAPLVSFQSHGERTIESAHAASDQRPSVGVPPRASLGVGLGLLGATRSESISNLWDELSGQELLMLRSRAGFFSPLAFSPNGKLLAAAGADRTVQVYVLDIRELLGLAGSRVTRALTPAECKLYFKSETCPPISVGKKPEER